METEVKHLEEDQLANGVVVRFYDESHRVGRRSLAGYSALRCRGLGFGNLLESGERRAGID